MTYPQVTRYEIKKNYIGQTKDFFLFNFVILGA